jgi:hypothetical protein
MVTGIESGHVLPVPAALPMLPRPGSVFALGWLMAELFDGRRRTSVADRQPAFNGALQLPLVGELGDADLLNFLVTDLSDLLGPYPLVSDAEVRAEAAKKAGTAGEPFDQGVFDASLGKLHLAILDELADEQEQLNAYQLGLALSDMCWLVAANVTADAFVAMFKRGQVATVQTWLNGAGTAIPPGAASIVGQSLSKWADWVDVNAPEITGPGAWASSADVVVNALRVQGGVWHSVLTADPEVSLQPAMGAWVQAASAVARATRTVTVSILKRFWPIVIIAVGALAGLLYLVISKLSGASQAWASLVTVVAVLGASGAGLGSGVTRAFGGIGFEIWSAAKLDAQAWNVTWLPALAQNAVKRNKLDNRGVAAPHIRKNVDRR